MRNLARKIHDEAANVPDADPVEQHTGRVLEVSADGSMKVRTAAGDHHAQRAFGCLVAPAVDDLVLVASSKREGSFVLAVLRRDGDACATMAIDGDLDVRLKSGRFRVAAQKGVDLVSAADVSVAARGVRVHASEGNVVVQSLSFLGDAMRAEIDRVKVIADQFDSVIDRFSQRVKRSFRTVEETDQLRAERIDYTADKTMSLHAEHALVTADELVKMDADQIHLG